MPAADWLTELRHKYGQVAEIRAQLRLVLSGLNPAEKRLLDLETPVERRMLVVGCGVGRETLALYARGWQVTGVDLVASVLSACHDMLQRRACPADLRHLAAPTPLPFADGAFSAVCLLAQVLEHPPTRRERLELLREAGRVLAAGGRLYLSTHAVLPGDGEELSRLASDLGRPRDIQARTISSARSGGALPLHLYTQDELCSDLRESGLDPLVWFIEQEGGSGHPVWRRFLYVVAGPG